MRFMFRKTITDPVERAQRLAQLFEIFEKKSAVSPSLAASETADLRISEDSGSHPHIYSTRKRPQNQPNLTPTLTKFFSNEFGQIRLFDLDFGGDIWD